MACHSWENCSLNFACHSWEHTSRHLNMNCSISSIFDAFRINTSFLLDNQLYLLTVGISFLFPSLLNIIISNSQMPVQVPLFPHFHVDVSTLSTYMFRYQSIPFTSTFLYIIIMLMTLHILYQVNTKIITFIVYRVKFKHFLPNFDFTIQIHFFLSFLSLIIHVCELRVSLQHIQSHWLVW